MSRPDPNLLHTAVGWQLDKAQVMSDGGVQSRAVGPTTDLSKNSVTIEFVSSRLLVAVTIWDSGEAEVIKAPSVGEQEPRVEVLKLPDSAAVRDVLDGLKIELTRGST